MSDLATVDTAGAAQMVGLAKNTLEKMRVRGDGPPYCKLGRSVRYRVSDLQAFLSAAVVHSTSQRARAA